MSSPLSDDLFLMFTWDHQNGWWDHQTHQNGINHPHLYQHLVHDSLGIPREDEDGGCLSSPPLSSEPSLESPLRGHSRQYGLLLHVPHEILHLLPIVWFQSHSHILDYCYICYSSTTTFVSKIYIRLEYPEKLN